MTDYADALAADFGSDDSDSEEQIEHTESIEKDTNSPQNLEQVLQATKKVDLKHKLQQIDPKTMFSVAELSQISSNMGLIRQELEKYADKFNVEYMELVAGVTGSTQSDEYMFLMRLSALPDLISDEIEVLHKYVSSRYKAVFPELETLAKNSVDYCRIVATIGQDLDEVRTHQEFLKLIFSGEKVLAIVMAAIQQAPKSRELRPLEWTSVKEACQAAVDLGAFLKEVTDFVADKLSKYAPNVSAIVGEKVASQLLISTGSLAQLALTPSCNLPSFGVRDLLSQQSTRTTHIRSTGYLYHCLLVCGMPPENVKQALRIVSGKVILAARIDVSRSSPGGELGAKFRREIQEKLDKLLIPPDQSGPKALPVPQERKSKKRAGRRLRKMKERFNMSELRKAQNKMEFGKEERTITDSFGEEVGLGMSRDLDAARANRNTDARLSKAMISRLQKQKETDTMEGVFAAAKRGGTSTGSNQPTKRPRII